MKLEAAAKAYREARKETHAALAKLEAIRAQAKKNIREAAIAVATSDDKERAAFEALWKMAAEDSPDANTLSVMEARRIAEQHT